MSINYFDTHQEYQKLKSMGLSDKDAEIQLSIMKEMRDGFYYQIKQWLDEAKRDFASQKMISILGAGIFIIGGFLIAQTWSMSIDIKTIITKLDILENRVDKIEDKVYR